MITNIGVYILKSKRTKKYYIGSSINLEGRSKRHFSELKNNVHHNMNLQNIYNKYGEKDVSFMVVKYFKYIENARKLEDKLIKKIF